MPVRSITQSSRVCQAKRMVWTAALSVCATVFHNVMCVPMSIQPPFYIGVRLHNLQCGTTIGQVVTDSALGIERHAFQHEAFGRVIALKSAPVYAQRLHT